MVVVGYSQKKDKNKNKKLAKKAKQEESECWATPLVLLHLLGGGVRYAYAYVCINCLPIITAHLMHELQWDEGVLASLYAYTCMD